MNKVIITIAQINTIVGDVTGNSEKILSVAQQMTSEQADIDIIVFPEMSLTGYPPEDLLFRDQFHQSCEQALELLIEKMPKLTLIIGMPWRSEGHIYNSAVVLQNHQVQSVYHKHYLPNHTVFDELRYFTPGTAPVSFDVNGVCFGLLICEDLWHSEPCQQLSKLGIDAIISLNASPFDQYKHQKRKQVLSKRAQEIRCPIVYCNLIGGQDELVFDGGSMILDQTGQQILQAPFFKEAMITAQCQLDNQSLQFKPSQIDPEPDPLQHIYQALVLGLKDYVNKNRFPGVLLGLSGGIDSALSLAIAYDALGPDRITTVMMPSEYTSSISIDDALLMANLLGIQHRSLHIDHIREAFHNQLKPYLEHSDGCTTLENIQARARGVLLMALSNQSGDLVITTGNRSELAVGYCTLYGDMAGGFCVLKDIPKTTVFALANFRNRQNRIIPQRIIDRPPSAELALDQTDQDSLPNYEVLDDILYQLINQERSCEEISQSGHDSNLVNDIANKVTRNEYKRRQGTIGVRISEYAFGKDRRYPITNKA